MTDEELSAWFERKADGTPMPETRKCFMAAADAFKERSERQNPQPLTGWVSVKDRMPEDGLNILVANIGTGTQYVSHKDLIFFDENKSAFVHTSYLREFQFTHWMPLPEPPEVKDGHY